MGARRTEIISGKKREMIRIDLRKGDKPSSFFLEDD